MRPAKRDRGGAFLFNPRDYLTDPVLLRMTLEERGAYSTLLFALWELPEPGVVEDNDLILARLAGATPKEWAKVKPCLAGAFDTTSRVGWWIQKRLVRTHAEQSQRVAHLRRIRVLAGKKGNQARWRQGDTGVAIAKHLRSQKDRKRSLVLGTGNMEQGSEEDKEKTHTRAAPAAPRAKRSRTPKPQTLPPELEEALAQNFPEGVNDGIRSLADRLWNNLKATPEAALRVIPLAVEAAIEARSDDQRYSTYNRALWAAEELLLDQTAGKKKRYITFD